MRQLLFTVILVASNSISAHADLNDCLRHIYDYGGRIAGDLQNDGPNYVISGWDNATRKIYEAERRGRVSQFHSTESDKIREKEWKTIVYTPTGKVVVGPGTECVTSKDGNVFSVLANRLKHNQVYDPKSEHYRGKDNTRMLLAQCHDVDHPDVKAELDKIAKANGLKIENGMVTDAPATAR